MPLTPIDKVLLDRCAIVISTLRDNGKFYAIGGIAYTVKGKFLMTTTDLYDTIKKLGALGVEVIRTDSGGNPTWAIKTS